MKINEKYIEALKQINDWTTVSEWAIKVGIMYPDLLDKANREAASHKRPSTGLRELAARISSWISTGDFAELVEVDESERPRKVRYLSGEQKAALIEKEIDEDIEPLIRAQKIRNDRESLTTKESYRLEEMQAIADTLNSFFRLDFEVDHSQALLNAENPGRHHLSRRISGFVWSNSLGIGHLAFACQNYFVRTSLSLLHPFICPS